MSSAVLLLGLAPGLALQEPFPLGAGGPEDLSGAGHAFVELATERSIYFVDEPFTLVLRLGFEREFLHERLIQLFRLPLDVPAQLEAPWLADLPGARALVPGVPSELGSALDRPTFALGEAVTEALRSEERARDGRSFLVLEIERSFLPLGPGELEIPAPILRFAFATSFEERPIEGRVPSDERLAFVAGEPLSLRVVPLPEEGRPPDFSGAVGHSFRVRAETDARSVGVEESFALELVVEGVGNLDAFPAPRLAPPGFHVFGTVDDAGQGWRRITYDLAPLSADVRAVPPLELVVFDTEPEPGEPAAYRTLRTEPIPLEVRAPSAPAADTREPVPVAAAESTRSRWPLRGALALVALLALWFVLRRRG